MWWRCGHGWGSSLGVLGGLLGLGWGGLGAGGSQPPVLSHESLKQLIICLLWLWWLRLWWRLWLAPWHLLMLPLLFLLCNALLLLLCNAKHVEPVGDRKITAAPLLLPLLAQLPSHWHFMASLCIPHRYLHLLHLHLLLVPALPQVVQVLPTPQCVAQLLCLTKAEGSMHHIPISPGGNPPHH